MKFAITLIQHSHLTLGVFYPTLGNLKFKFLAACQLWLCPATFLTAY